MEVLPDPIEETSSPSCRDLARLKLKALQLASVRLKDVSKLGHGTITKPVAAQVQLE